MIKNDLPLWVKELPREDLEFVRKFVINSGSLKSLSREYDVSYPTIRQRLDVLIQKIQLFSNINEEPMIGYIKNLAIENHISLEIAQALINKYKNERNI